jgi:Protein of unknown function (DUF1488)
MALSFPNSSRSYDETHSRIRFLGYDGMFEVRFYVPAEVLTAGLSHWTASESDYLASFDALRSKILDAAKSAYKSRPNRTITLALEHFK